MYQKEMNEAGEVFAKNFDDYSIQLHRYPKDEVPVQAEGAIVRDVTFRNRMLKKMGVWKTEIHDSELSGCEFYGSYAEDSRFYSSNLSSTRFEASTFKSSSFRRCKMSDVTFFDCDINKSAFKDCDLQRARFHILNVKRSLDANDNDAELLFDCCNLSKSSFREIDVETKCKAYIYNCNLDAADFTGVDFFNLCFSLTPLDTGDPFPENMIMPDGRPWSDYKKDHLEGICHSPRIRALFEKAWGKHSWGQCPMSAAFGFRNEHDVPTGDRIKVNCWVTLYDMRLLDHPSQMGKT